MFLIDVPTAQFSKRQMTDKEVEEKLAVKLRRLGYISYQGKARTEDMEKLVINIANSKPELIKIIGEPLVYRFMDRER